MPIRMNSSGPSAFCIALKVVPGATRDRIVGAYGEALKVAVTQPPEDGRANDAVEKLLREQLCLPRRQAALVGGFHSRDKVLRVTGLTREELSARLEALLKEP
jgi:uncharacterized protein (TIGR00251 family)